MSDSSQSGQRDLDALLAPATAASFVGDVRQRLLERTASRVRFRRRLRRVGALAALALMFIAGLLVRGWVEPAPAPEVVRLPASPQTPDPPSTRLWPSELERQAEGIFVRAESARRFREAGDGYLAEFGDLRGALRCYRNFLDEADHSDLAESDSDTWLLASLKKERLKENSDGDDSAN
jgi:hypothetical protein